MRKAKLTAWILTAALAGGTVLAGCGSTTGEEQEPVVAEIIDIGAEDPYETIGDPSASVELFMTNEMGGTITGLSVKAPGATVYPANMMTAGQTLENEQTARFYYEPGDVEAVEVVEIDPFDDVVGGDPAWADVGYWGVTGGGRDVELTVWNVADSLDEVTFSLWWNDIAETDEITVELGTDRIGTFTGYINDVQIAGRIAFTGDTVVISLDQCPLAQIEEGMIVFSTRHDTAWKYADSEEEYEDEWTEEDEQAVEEQEAELETAVSYTSTYSLQVTMQGGDVYEITYFDLEDIQEVVLCLDDDIAYLEYYSISTNAKVNTKDIEQSAQNERAAAQLVIDMINAIDPVTEANAKSMQPGILTARAAYEALTAAQKAMVTNLSVLEEREYELALYLGDEALEQTEETSTTTSSGYYDDDYYTGGGTTNYDDSYNDDTGWEDDEEWYDDEDDDSETVEEPVPEPEEPEVEEPEPEIPENDEDL